MWWGSETQSDEDEEEKNQSPSQSSSKERFAHPLFQTTLLPYNESIERTRNCWSDPPASNFSVRGKHYLDDRKKIPATHSRYSLLGMDILKRSSGPLGHVAKRDATSFSNARSKGFTGFVFVLNFMLPDLNVVVYWTPTRNVIPGKKGKKIRKKKKVLKDYLTGHPTFDNLMEKFVENDDDFRNSRLKVIPVLVKGGWFLAQVVNGRPAIICNKIQTKWHRDLSPSTNYLEADIEITSSSMAMGILQLVKMSAHTVALDMAFTIEGQGVEELPEEVLCALRFNHLEPDNATEWPLECVHASDDQNDEGIAGSDGDESSSSLGGLSDEESGSKKKNKQKEEPPTVPAPVPGGGKKKKRGKKGRKNR